jgi:hypothetical protein
MECFVLSHNGLGDNILMVGALNYLSKFYKNVFFLCKDTNIHHMNFIFKNTNIFSVGFDSKKEYSDCFEILKDKYSTFDVFISGCHKSYLKTRKRFRFPLNHVHQNIFIPSHYNFGADFYRDIDLNPSIMISNFQINISDEVIQLYNNISKYKIIFLHTESSQTVIDLNHIITRFILESDYLLLCPNTNLYHEHHEKYSLANKYIKLPTIFHYTEIIKNAEELHMVDSSISCLSLCLNLSRQTLCKKLQIYNRFTCIPIDLSV